MAAFLALVCGLVSLASFELILVPLQTELQFSVDNANALIFMPAAASLLVVFIAGSLADRWGPRRPLVISAALFAAGAVMVGLAPNLMWVVVGRVFDGVSGVTMAIVSLSVINSSSVDPGRRARLFGIYAAVAPAMFIVSPAVSALIVQSAGWRAAVIPWILVSGASLAATLRYIPRTKASSGREWVTPLLAGVVLAGVALGILNFTTHPTVALGAFVAAVVALVMLVPLMRRMSAPALNLGWCRGRGMFILLAALAVASMPNLFFYTKLLLQYRYVVPLIEIALLMAIPQACAIAGGLLSGPISARIGSVRAATGALVLSAVACLSVFFVTGQSPIWVPVLAMSLCAAPMAFLVGPMTNSFLSRAPAEASGAASSMRKATWTIGGVVGGAVIGAISFSAFQSRLAGLLESSGVTASHAELLARDIRNGAVVDELVAKVTDPRTVEALVSKGPALLEAQSTTFVVMGVVSACMYLAGALLMLTYQRRMSSGEL